MYKKKLFLLFSMIFLFSIMFVSAIPPVQTTIVADQGGLTIKDIQTNYIKLNSYHNFRFRVYNSTNNLPLNDDAVNCSIVIIDQYGNPFLQIPVVTAVGYVFSINVSAGNFTERGTYHKGINCITNDGVTAGGVSTRSFEVNGFGEGLDTAHSIKFNSAMFFMLVLFCFALVGLFKVENYIGKLALYWVTHVLFVAGTFLMWQFNIGYTTVFLGMAGIWKVLFYVSITAVIPMIILSMVWIFYIHLFNENFQKLIDKGEDPEKAFAIAKKKSGGWFGGKNGGK